VWGVIQQQNFQTKQFERAKKIPVKLRAEEITYNKCKQMWNRY
jgi:hypothetical protein